MAAASNRQPRTADRQQQQQQQEEEEEEEERLRDSHVHVRAVLSVRVGGTNTRVRNCVARSVLAALLANAAAKKSTGFTYDAGLGFK